MRPYRRSIIPRRNSLVRCVSATTLTCSISSSLSRSVSEKRPKTGKPALLTSTSTALDARGQRVELLMAAGHQDAIEAIAGKQQRQLVADAARGAGDQRRLAHGNIFSPARTGTGSQFSRGASGQAHRAS